MTHQSQQTCGVLLLLVVVAGAAAAAPAQQPAQQTRSTSAAAAPPPAPAPATNKTKSAPKSATASAIDELNSLPCERIRCSASDLDPVCAVGKGVGGCQPADKGCTYTNGCLARCVYGVKVSYLGECKHEGAMRIVEEGQGRGAPAKPDCKCDWRFEPVCASIPACTIPGGCTYASDCYARCAGAAEKDIRKGACKNSRRLLDQQRALMI